jgi:hypothetical protein
MRLHHFFLLLLPNAANNRRDASASEYCVRVDLPSLGIEHGPKESSIIADDALCFFSIFEGSYAGCVLKGLFPILLVLSQAWECEHRERNIIGTL